MVDLESLCAQLPVGVVRAGQHATLAVHPADPPAAGGRPLRAPEGAGGLPAAARCHSADVLSDGALLNAMRGSLRGEARSGREEESQGRAGGEMHSRRSSTPGLGTSMEDASCGVRSKSGREAARGGPQGGSAGGGRAPRARQGQGAEQQEEVDLGVERDREAEQGGPQGGSAGGGRAPRGNQEQQEEGDLGVERDREAQRLRQRPAAHPTEAYREPWPPRARGSDTLHAPRPPAPAQPQAAAAGLGQGAEACSSGGGGARQRKEPPCALEVPEYGTGLEFSNTNGSGRGHPGDPPGPPPAPDGGAAGASAGLHWDPEPARWELRSRSAPPGASAACSPPNSRKVRG